MEDIDDREAVMYAFREACHLPGMNVNTVKTIVEAYNLHAQSRLQQAHNKIMSLRDAIAHKTVAIVEQQIKIARYEREIEKLKGKK